MADASERLVGAVDRPCDGDDEAPRFLDPRYSDSVFYSGSALSHACLIVSDEQAAEDITTLVRLDAAPTVSAAA
jgi:hypothetical protein